MAKGSMATGSMALAINGVPVRWTQETYCDGADKWERCLRGEEAAGSDFGETFFQGEKLVNFPPLVSVTEISRVPAHCLPSSLLCRSKKSAMLSEIPKKNFKIPVLS
jgi:hypothetical protein